MKNVLIVVGMLVVFNAVLVFSGALDRLVATNQETTPTPTLEPDVVDVFRFTLEDEVNKKLGVPIEGYEPQMFITVFPGLVKSDFHTVSASIGQYVFENGELRHQVGEGVLMHSAAGAITREGYSILLQNVAKRLDVDLAGEGTITEIIDAII